MERVLPRLKNKVEATVNKIFKSFSLKGDISKLSIEELNSYANKMIKLSDSIIELLTTCIIVNRLDGKSLSISAKLDNIINSSSNFFEDIIKDNILGTGCVMKSFEVTKPLHILNFLIVFDSEAYNSEIMFAYKAFEDVIKSGGTVSDKEVIIGRSLDGRNIRDNFSDSGNISIAVIGASRSGKGVTTLNMLATLVASKCPFVYMDNKPDMACTLWKLEKEVAKAP